MVVDVFLTKGMRIRARWFKPKALGTYSIAGAQPKLVGNFVEVVGTIRHVRGDDPIAPKDVRLYVEADTDEGLGSTCEKCNVKEIEVDPKWIVEILT